MIAGRQRSIGIGREVTWGTAVAPATFYSGTESIEEERGRLREEMVFGSRSQLTADPGRLRIRGGINGIHARLDGIGHLLRAALGAPTVTGTNPNFVHTFVPSVTPFSADAALPPYSITVRRGGTMIHRYAGGQCSRLSLRQERDGILMVDSDWLARGVSNVADTTMVLESSTRLRYRHLAVNRAATPFLNVESLTINIDNGLETEEVFNQSDEISAVGFGGNSMVEVEMTLRFETAHSYADFSANTVNAWSFVWTLAANRTLTIEMPQLNISRWSSPTANAGRLTITVGGVAEFAPGAGHDLRVILANGFANYNA